MNKCASIRFMLVLALAAWAVRAQPPGRRVKPRAGSAGTRAGVELQSPLATVSLDRDAKGTGPILRFPGKGG